MSSQTDPVPPVPQHTSPVETVSGLQRFTNNWMQWFLLLREKINVINDSLVTLGLVTDPGLLAKQTDGTWASRTIEGTSGRTTVDNGTGDANPVIDFVDEAIEDIVGNMIEAGSNVTVDYDDTTGIVTISASGGGSGGGVGDAFYSNVKSLLHFNGTDGSTTFVDQRFKTWTASGAARIDTENLKFGESTLRTGGGYIHTPSSVDFDITGNFTLDIWLYKNAAGAGSQQAVTIDGAGGVSTGHYINIGNTGGIGMLFAKASAPTSGMFVGTGAGVFPLGQWVLVSIQKVGLSVAVRLDGTTVATGTLTEQPAAWASGRTVRIGAYYDGSGAFDGYAKDFRFTANARYEADFTAPTATFWDATQ